MKHYIVGIDLGTSNTVVAYAAPDRQRVELFEIEQLVAPGQVAAQRLLPSVRYHPAEGEISAADRQLPWSVAEQDDRALGGRLALALGAQVPGRLVTSAKSWLSHDSVDRTAPILPWGAAADVARISPVAASAGYLAHVRAAWRQRFPEAPLEQQEVILTVPASFDEGARALTLEAARQVGLTGLRLLEEPQAAFYDWLFRHRRGLAAELADTRLLLVCDVGGGTTDLTLIQVATDGGEPQLTRIGVGKHLMLGGDNMDLALAHCLESRLRGGGERLNAAAFSQLVARCRAAKEQLLCADAPEAVRLTLLGGGARLIGGARSVELTRDEVVRLLVDGFFPRVGPEEPLLQRRGAIVELALPYPADPAITRHVAAFLRRHAHAARRALGGDGGDAILPVPDTVLFNGGVFRAAALAERLRDTLGDWRGAPPRILHSDDPDVAVARGAVAYALVREGHGPWIGGGSPRSYFLIVDDEAHRGICILPRGTEEGREIRLAEHNFGLRLGRPVRFHLASSVNDAAHSPGEIAVLGDEDFVRLPPLTTVLPVQADRAQREVRVELLAAMTEVGTLELQCISTDEPARRWRLEFELRREGGESLGRDGTAGVPPPGFAAAVDCLGSAFGAPAEGVEGRAVRRLRGQLERVLGKRENWDLPLLRALFDALMQRARRRRRSAEHERVWLNLAGFCLRPGLGEALDGWRIEQLGALFESGIEYVGDSQNWSEWWTLWRRVAAGVPADLQQELLAGLGPALEAHATKPRNRLATAVAGSYDDMLRLLGSLERLPAEHKVEIGEWLLGGLRNGTEKPLGWWTLGRLGARQPLYGSAHQVVPADVVAGWLEALLALDWRRVEPAAFAATQLARLTGDRARDLPAGLRDAVLARLAASHAPAAWSEQLRTVVELDRADQGRAFGESLPAGLRLVPEGSPGLRATGT